jgi:4-amino-4-deoxy-L-arabinose transferase-like glycosyltransferase
MTHSVLSEPIPYKSIERREWLILIAAIFTAAIVIRLVCYTGLIASDDVDYGEYAERIVEGTYRVEPHHFAGRYGIIVPLAVLYRLFGMHEWTTVALPLVCSSLAAVLTAIIAARLSGLPAAWAAGMLMATLPADVRVASVLVPEPILQAILLAGALLFLLAERQNPIFLGLAAGGVFGLSYLTKEPGAFVAMAFFAYALVRRQWRLAFSLAAGVAAVVAGELAWYWSQSGDLLFRLHAMGVHNRSPMAIDANQLLSYRLWKIYPRMMLVPNVDFGLHSLFALALAALASWRWRSSEAVLLLMLWAILPFLYLNFGTSSFSQYWALPTDPRYISLVYPPLFVLAAIVLFDWTGNRLNQTRLVSAALAVICIIGFFCALALQRTGHRAEEVRYLREITAAARQDNEQICEFVGPQRIRWRQTVELMAPDRIGCSSPTALRVITDSNGMPFSEHRSVVDMPE